MGDLHHAHDHENLVTPPKSEEPAGTGRYGAAGIAAAGMSQQVGSPTAAQMDAGRAVLPKRPPEFGEFMGTTGGRDRDRLVTPW